MSLKDSHSSTSISVSCNFVLKWKPDKSDLEALSKNPSDVVIRSNLFRFKSMQDLRFYLEIRKLDSEDMVANIRGSKNTNFRLIYAFVVCDDRAFQLKASSQLSFLTSCRAFDIIYANSVAIQCLVNVCPIHPLLSSEEDNDLLQKGQTKSDFEGLPNFTFSTCCDNEMILCFFREGIIPDFTVEFAIEILNMFISECEVLNILCAEYLMKNITAKNFIQIVSAALTHDLRLLQIKCLEEIVDGHYEIKEKA